MKIAIITVGSRGDVQPYVALGSGLKAAGYDVRVLATDDFEALVQDAGLTFCSTGVNVQSVITSDEWRKTIGNGNFVAIQWKMRQALKEHAEGIGQVLHEHCQGVNLIIGGMGALSGGFAVAEKLHIPIIHAHVFPITPTSAFPSPVTANLPLGNALNRLSFYGARQVLWHSLRIADVTTRKHLDMPQASFWGPYAAMEREQIPTIYGYSPHILPPPDDWADHHHVTGYWFLEAADNWTPPAELVEFLNAGSPPVYVGFGSMSGGDPYEAAQITLEALSRSGQRGIIASGWGGLSSSDVPETVYMLESAPHSWLFPQMAAVVHHGGAGTTAAGLRAGVPTIIVPFFGDQPFWGKQVAERGVGPQPIPRKKLTADALTAAISQAVNDATMRQRAAEIGEHIRNEDGIKQAVAIISGYLAQQQSASPMMIEV